ncbi:MAG: aminopeptidase [Phycisphaeraceae bacterium]|nr:aminopeptidase [Phycisphaeraceae bacterium]
MRDPLLDKLARVLVHHCARVEPNDLVTIVGDTGCSEAVEAVFEEALRAGAHPSFHVRSDALHELLLRYGTEVQLRHICPFEDFRLEHCDVLIFLKQPRNTRSPGRIDAANAVLAQAARRGLIAKSLRRAAEDRMRYVLTEIPGHAAAQDAEMSLEQYADRVYRAGFLHLPDPLQEWRRLHACQQSLCDFLSKKSHLRFRVPASAIGGRLEGTDLTVDVSSRAWVNCAGGENFPDGEVFSGPRDVNGVVTFNFPAVHRGKEMDGIRLRFRDGRVVEASATTSQDHLLKLLDMDEGSRNAGEIGIGTNYQLTEIWKNAFFDEKIGGTFHIALGAGYPETGNTNQSGLHWDLVCDLRNGGTIEADGEVIQRDGRFLNPGFPRADGPARHSNLGSDSIGGIFLRLTHGRLS